MNSQDAKRVLETALICASQPLPLRDMRVLFNEDRRRVHVMLSTVDPAPKALRLTLLHGARASDDQVIMLGAIAPGFYAGTLREPPAGGWQLRLEDGEGTWRIMGSWKTQQPGASLGKAP